MKLAVAAYFLVAGATACSQLSGPPALTQSGVAQVATSSSGFKTILLFDRSNGCAPYAGPVARKTTLYGTTTCGGRFGNGEVYRLASDGKVHIVHSFSSDATWPYAPVIAVGKTLYGTAAAGGTHSKGTVYSLDVSGKEEWVYSFKGPPDGANPHAGLIDVDGTLYGTTLEGGTGSNCWYYSSGCGTVFKITPDGKESLVYSFQGGNDGFAPWAGLAAVNGVLYGVTYDGGAEDNGTIFSVTSAGAEKVLHTFGGGSDDGAQPMGSMISVRGALYGTTQWGGTDNAGTLFSITPSGQEKIVYSFNSSYNNDGTEPDAGVTYANGKFYGTTTEGGASNDGTVYEVTLSGKEEVLHSFTGASDGSDPESQLAAVKGALYGTTLYAGTGSYSYGSIFEVTL
jgi:uncharacterized repeat protein (TIGR03803 family)